MAGYGTDERLDAKGRKPPDPSDKSNEIPGPCRLDPDDRRALLPKRWICKE
jgi:hypothetical protein